MVLPAQSRLLRHAPMSLDVWFSEDGTRWVELEDTAWDYRHACSVFVYCDALWMVSGNGNDHRELLAEVWKLETEGRRRGSLHDKRHRL